MDYKTNSQYYGKSVKKPTQQVEQPQETEQQNQQVYEKQLYDKWYSIFANGNDKTFAALFGGTGKYGVISAADNLKVPEDDTERNIAIKAAQDFCTYCKSLNIYSINPKNKSTVTGKEAVRLTRNYDIARSFIANCLVYSKKKAKADNKEVKSMYKEGVAGYGQMDVQPRSTNAKDIFEAAERAGKQAALLFKNNDIEGLKSTTAVIQNNLSNKEYNVVFYYTYLSNIKYPDVKKEQDRVNRLNSLKLQYENYEQQANNNEFKPGVYDRVKQNNQNTTQQVYGVK